MSDKEKRQHCYERACHWLSTFNQYVKNGKEFTLQADFALAKATWWLAQLYKMERAS